MARSPQRGRLGRLTRRQRTLQTKRREPTARMTHEERDPHMEGTTISTSTPTHFRWVRNRVWVGSNRVPRVVAAVVATGAIEEHQVRPPSKTDHSPMLFLLALLAIVASSYAFRSFGARSASISSARFLFGTPDPKKDEMKKSEGGGGISDPLYCLNIAQGCSEAWVTSWTR